MGAALRKFCKEDFDDVAVCLARAAKIVRIDIFQLQATFTGSFDEACQVNSVPQSLLTIVAMILDGPNIQSQSQSSSGTHQASLSVAQFHGKLGNLEIIWRHYSNFPGSVFRPSWNNWWQCCRVLEHFTILLYDQNQRPYQHRWSSKGAVHQEEENNGCHSTKTEVPSCSPPRGQSTGGTLLGSGNCSCSKAAIP